MNYSNQDYPNDWEEYEPEKTPFEKIKEKSHEIRSDVLRNSARIGTNLGTLAAGLPGSIASILNDYIAKPTFEFVTGKEGSPYAETLLGKALPTITTQRENVKRSLEKKLGEGYLQPQNKVEKFVDEVIDDTALLMTPGGQVTRSGRVITGAQKVYRNFAKSIGANLVKEGVDDFGGKEGRGDLAKLGSFFLMSILDKPAAARRLGQMYEAAERTIPQGATQNAAPLQQRMNQLTQNITRGRPIENLAPAERFVVEQANNVTRLIQNGQIPVEQAWAQLRTVNQHLQNILPELPWGQRAGVRTMVNQINNGLNETLRNYGTTNPQFANLFHPAQEAFATQARSNFVGNWVQKNVKNPILSEGLLSLFGSPIVKGASAALVPYKATQLMYRIQQSPTLRRLYSQTLGAATRENAVLFNKKLEELDKNLSEEMGNDLWEEYNP